MPDRIFRINFMISEFLEDGFYEVCSSCQVDKEKEKLIKIIDEQYKRAKKWINENYPDKA